MLPDLALLEHFHLLRPWWALLIIPWALIILVMNRHAERRGQFGEIIAPHLLKHLRVSRYRSRWLNPRRFTEVITILLIIVLLGPSWRQQPSPLSEDESALVVLLDVSSSMRQRDVQPSRLQRAKQKIGELLAMRPDKRAALIVYAGTAHTVLTLTADRDILDQYLAAITPGIMPRPGKFPEYALPEIDRVLADSVAPATVVMFADGTGADSEQAFSAYFRDHPHQLLVVGVGSVDVPEGEITLERDALRDVAASASGSYVDLTIDDADMRRVNRRIESHYVIRDDSALPWLDSGYPLVFPAMALFLMWFRKGWTLTWAWLLVPLLLVSQPAPVQAQETSSPENHWFADLWLTPDQQGRLLMQLGRYPEAATRFRDPAWKGLAYYYAEEFMLAAEYFSRSDSDDALFNEANARAQARDYVRAAHRYDRLLARNPDYPGAQHNRDRVQALIDEINRLSESQQEEPGVSGEDVELDSEDAIPAEGADTISWDQEELVQLSAEDILQDPATAAMWLRGVQQDPSDFLAIKFSMQLQQREPPAEAP